MTNMIKFAGVAAVVLGVAQSLQAVPITGSISLSGDATLNGSPGTATAVTSWVNPVTVGNPTGSFAGTTTAIFNDTVIMNNIVWNFNTGTTTPINHFWMVGAFSFELEYSHIVSQGNGSVDVSGWGWVSAAGFDTTQMSWNFSSPGTEPWTFSASSVTPDGGATVILLGIALSGIALLKKKLTA